MSSQALKTIEDLSTVEYLSMLINYLSVLQDGRTKPDTGSKGGYIRESVYNIDEIKEVKESINEVLRINRIPETIQFENKLSNKKYFK
jgi:hypothetical protein